MHISIDSCTGLSVGLLGPQFKLNQDHIQSKWIVIGGAGFTNVHTISVPQLCKIIRAQNETKLQSDEHCETWRILNAM